MGVGRKDAAPTLEKGRGCSVPVSAGWKDTGYFGGDPNYPGALCKSPQVSHIHCQVLENFVQGDNASNATITLSGRRNTAQGTGPESVLRIG